MARLILPKFEFNFGESPEPEPLPTAKTEPPPRTEPLRDPGPAKPIAPSARDRLREKRKSSAIAQLGGKWEGRR